MSEVTDKIKSDIAFWQVAMEKARETLTAGESVLPGLLRSLEVLSGTRGSMAGLAAESAGSIESTVDEGGGAPAPIKLDGVASGASTPTVHPTRRRTCIEEVQDALRRQAPQNSKDLEAILAANGTAFSPGAVGYALRDLVKTNRVEKVSKSGNLWYYRLADAGNGGGGVE